MKDPLVVLHEFSQSVAGAMNSNKVTPPEAWKDDEFICAVMIVVGAPGKGPPLGASLNWDVRGGFWRVDPQAQEAERVED